MAEAIAPFRLGPQVAAMREIAMEGACGPWSTPATRAASSRAACGFVGSSPMSMSQIIWGNVTFPMSCSMG